MTFGRFVFVFALGMLILGLVGSWVVLQPLFAQSRGPIAYQPARATATATRTPTATVAPGRTKPAIQRTAHPAARPQPASRRAARPRKTARPTPTPRPTPTATATTGTVTLARYWVDTLQARRGRIIAIGYSILNGTGRTVRVALGASLKPTRDLSWIRAGMSDPAHDVVAVVPPGISIHTRFFTLPASLRPGRYDVAWGLRNPFTGSADALVTAPAALQVDR